MDLTVCFWGYRVALEKYLFKTGTFNVWELKCIWVQANISGYILLATGFNQLFSIVFQVSNSLLWHLITLLLLQLTESASNSHHFSPQNPWWSSGNQKSAFVYFCVTGSPPYAFFPNTVEMWTLKSSSVHYWDLPMCLLTWRILDYFVLNTQYVNAWMSGMDWHSKHYLCKSHNRRVEGKWKGGGVGRRKKDDFVFLWGQCLLEGNDTIDSFHSHANHHDILFLWLDTMHPPKLPIPQHDFQTVHVGVGVKAQEQCSCYAYMMCLWMLLHTVCKMLQDSRIHNITAQYKTSI